MTVVTFSTNDPPQRGELLAAREVAGVPVVVVDDRAVTAPPASPAVGYRCLVGVGTGAFSGRNGALAIWLETGRWAFVEPPVGQILMVRDEGRSTILGSTGWVDSLIPAAHIPDFATPSPLTYDATYMQNVVDKVNAALAALRNGGLMEAS